MSDATSKMNDLREVMAALENFFECVDLQFTAQDEAASKRLSGEL